jgi:hypothetical protein
MVAGKTMVLSILRGIAIGGGLAFISSPAPVGVGQSSACSLSKQITLTPPEP